MALVQIRRLELKIGSVLNVLRAVRNEEQILLAPGNPTKLDGHGLSLTAAGQSAEMISTLLKSPLSGFSSLPILPDFGPLVTTFPV